MKKLFVALTLVIPLASCATPGTFNAQLRVGLKRWIGTPEKELENGTRYNVRFAGGKKYMTNVIEDWRDIGSDFKPGHYDITYVIEKSIVSDVLLTGNMAYCEN
jgi:hypothetical protein